MDIIYFSLNKWSSTSQRVHHIAKYLSRNHRVIFVNPAALSILGFFRNKLFGDKSRNFTPKIARFDKNLWVFWGPPLLHFSESFSAINSFNHQIIELTLKHYLRELEFSDPILWITSPLQTPVIGGFNERKIVYDCMDHHAAFYQLGSRQAKLVTKLEKKLIGKADIIFCTSSSLYQRIKSDHENTFLIRNAVSEAFLDPGISFSPPDDFPSTKGPIIGYVGTIYRWVDLDAILEIANKRQNWTIVMIGPIHIKMPTIGNVKNLYFLGEKSYADIPRYLSRIDVGIIPFKLNDLTINVNPVKLYEYFAFGIPVVSTFLPEVALYKDLCYLVETPDMWIEKVEQAIAEKFCSNANDLKNQRKKIASENTWRNRIEKIHEIITNY
jgi:glycosyltransferase involved in cell wall biosynthesis